MGLQHSQVHYSQEEEPSPLTGRQEEECELSSVVINGYEDVPQNFYFVMY